MWHIIYNYTVKKESSYHAQIHLAFILEDNQVESLILLLSFFILKLNEKPTATTNLNQVTLLHIFQINKICFFLPIACSLLALSNN